jgi:hypothetical protein
MEHDALELVKLGGGITRTSLILHGKAYLSVPGPGRLPPRRGGGLFRLRWRDVDLANEWLTGVGSKVGTKDENTQLG